MSIFEASGIAFLGFLLLVLREWLVAELTFRVQLWVRKSVNETIASASVEIQEEWGEEWLADMEITISAPITACVYATNLRRSARAMSCEQSTLGTPTGAVAGRVGTRDVAMWLALFALEVPNYVWKWFEGALWRAPLVLGVGLSPVGWALTGLRGALVVGAIGASATLVGAVSHRSSLAPKAKQDEPDSCDTVDPEPEVAE